MSVATAEDMRAFGARIANAISCAGLSDPFVLGLSGDLGAGKTTLVSGLLAEFGHAGPARSPTYSLIEPYRIAGRDVYHADLYRLRDPAELEDLGLRDLLVGPSVLIVEWPEMAGTRLRKPDLSLRLEYVGEGRQVGSVAGSEAGRRVVAGLALDPA